MIPPKFSADGFDWRPCATCGLFQVLAPVTTCNGCESLECTDTYPDDDLTKAAQHAHRASNALIGIVSTDDIEKAKRNLRLALRYLGGR